MIHEGTCRQHSNVLKYKCMSTEAEICQKKNNQYAKSGYNMTTIFEICQKFHILYNICKYCDSDKSAHMGSNLLGGEPK